MDTLRTMFRLAVMTAVMAVGYKMWQAYGPPVAEVKMVALRALEMAKVALEKTGTSGSSAASLVADPRPMAPPEGVQPPQAASLAAPPGGQVIPARSLAPLSDPPAAASLDPPALVTAPANQNGPPAQAISLNSLSDSAAEHPQLLSLYSRLEALGATQPRLTAWGTRSGLYRFSCEASPASASALRRQFEAIAAEPAAAVAEVVAKVESWRANQPQTGRLDGTSLR